MTSHVLMLLLGNLVMLYAIVIGARPQKSL